MVRGGPVGLTRGSEDAESGLAGYTVQTDDRDGSQPLIFGRPRVDLPIEGRFAPSQPLQDFALPVKELPVDAVVRRTGPLFVPLVDRQNRWQLKHFCQVLGREEDGPLIEGLGTHSETLRINRDSGADHHALVIKSPVIFRRHDSRHSLARHVPYLRRLWPLRQLSRVRVILACPCRPWIRS
jgi:hypothetical protein